MAAGQKEQIVLKKLEKQERHPAANQLRAPVGGGASEPNLSTGNKIDNDDIIISSNVQLQTLQAPPTTAQPSTKPVPAAVAATVPTPVPSPHLSLSRRLSLHLSRHLSLHLLRHLSRHQSRQLSRCLRGSCRCPSPAWLLLLYPISHLWFETGQRQCPTSCLAVKDQFHHLCSQLSRVRFTDLLMDQVTHELINSPLIQLKYM